MSSSTSAMRTSAGIPAQPMLKSLQRLGIGVLLFAGITLQALAQSANRLEGITYTTGAGNRIELTLRLSDNAPTPLTFTVDNPARIALDLPDTTVAMTSRDRISIARPSPSGPSRRRPRSRSHPPAWLNPWQQLSFSS